jgi:hypothetical protein
MRVKHLLRAAMFAILLTPISSQSEESKQDVQQLYRQCKTPAKDVERTFCVAFISGVAEQMIATGKLAAKQREEGNLANDKDRALLSFLSACPKASFGAMVQAFINWAERHPEEWSSPRQLGVMQVLRETWPCK